ncbi:natural killer cells antigen CD94-like [Penaeus indicus]|uniref:natural killer cells antigen CD94-like n=1 Tax=Penaeus indicus TaxID=29960 RepID=UPI00300CE8E4
MANAKLLPLGLVLLAAMTVSSEQVSSTKISSKTCYSPFDLVGGKCILVDIFESVTWMEAKYLCEKFEAELVTIENTNFFGALLDYLHFKELSDHDYWVGANDTETEGEWAWLNGTPVRMGTPLWALYRYSSSDYEQEPTSSDSSSSDCAFMDKSRFLYLEDGDCDSTKAAICQLPPGASASAGTLPKTLPKRKPRRRP